MYDLKLKQMECFLEVAESLNITASAKKLFISQPLASKWIKSLENELDLPLFIRDGNTLILTKEGEYLRKRWIPVFKELRDSVEDAHSISGRIEGTIRLGCPESYLPGIYLQEILDAYREKNPGVHFQITSHGLREVADLLIAEKLDVALHTTLDLKDNTDFLWIPLKKMHFCIALGKNHPLAQKPDLTIEDLKDEIFCILNQKESPTSVERIRKQCKKAGFYPKEIHEVENFSSLAMSLIYENRVSVLPEECIANFRNDLAIFDTDEVTTTEYIALLRRAEHTGDPAKRFAEFVSNYVKESPLL